MSSEHPPFADALNAAVVKVESTVALALERVLNTMAAAAASTARLAERDVLLDIQLQLRQKANAFLDEFSHAFEQQVHDEVSPRSALRSLPEAADWESLSLVDNQEVEGRMVASRLGQQIAHACESQLRELAGYIASVLGLARADEERNPLRPAVVGQALNTVIEHLMADADARRLLVREFGTALALSMPACYGAVVEDLRGRRVAPVRLAFRGVDGPALHVQGHATGGDTAHQEPASTRPLPGDAAHRATVHTAGTSVHGSDFTPGSGSASGHHLAHGSGPPHRSLPNAADPQLISLLHRLSQLTARDDEFDTLLPVQQRRAAGPAGSAGSAPISGQASVAAELPGVSGGWPRQAGPANGLMAVNLIHAHREALVQASSAKLDHMVIDVVGSLFDQILSDSRVPPQMARQIARLQLPVLRVALADASFFSSRRHPVRRFVNRIASLACAFEDFSEGPGARFLARVSEIVQQIVEGDFEQADLYTAKIIELEAFISQQTREQLQDSGAPALLESKESELQIQQRYLQQLKIALAPVAMPEYLRSFLCQVWSQALVLSTQRQGGDSDLARRLRRAGRDMVMSVQPKGSPLLRKRFLMQLPMLMKDLAEGLQLIGWSEAAKKQFLAQLLPSHAESLKGASLSELDYNMLSRQLDTLFAAPIPGHAAPQPFSPQHNGFDEPAKADAALFPLPSADIEQRFSPQEAAAVGLVPEQAVDWNSRVDIDLSAETPAVDNAADPTPAPADVSGGIDLALTAPDPASIPAGADLMKHIQLGFAYQMLLKDEWQRVRLSYVSPARSFFVFSRGSEPQQTVSVTARMLARMCSSGRMRPVEHAYLMERATARARKQLAALRTTASR